MSDSLDNVIGPCLPSHFPNEKNEELPSIIGPVLPPHLSKPTSCSIGPQLPPNLSNCQEDVTTNIVSQLPSNDAVIEQTVLGPQLPPHLLKKASIGPSTSNSNRIVGPTLPPHLRQRLEQESDHKSDDAKSDEEETYGPVPAGFSQHSSAQVALEERALQLQIDQLMPEGNNEPVRESWMTELPAAKAAHFGLGPRQFRAKAAPDMSDRSSWTDIAGEKGKKQKEEKVDLKAEAEYREMKRRDKEQEAMSKKHKRKSKSLVEMHEEKIRKKEVNVGPAERRPFSREVDLQVNKFDDAQKKAIMKKAQLLDDRFSSGKSKFL